MLRNVRQPFRLVVCSRMFRRGRLVKGRAPLHRGAHSVIEPTIGAYIYWTPDTSAEPWRTGYGSFCFNGISAVHHAVRALLQDSAVTQISIRTNQDRTWFVINRHADGRVTISSREVE